MINIILALLKYYRSNSSFLTFCAGYRSHYVCNDVSIWFAYKWSKMLTKKLAPCLKRFSIFQLTKCHQKTSVFTKCPRDPQKWTIAPALHGLHGASGRAPKGKKCIHFKDHLNSRSRSYIVWLSVLCSSRTKCVALSSPRARGHVLGLVLGPRVCS